MFCTTSLAHGFNSGACLDAIHIIIHHNIFRFRDTTWVLQNGTAIGTPPALAYAQLYLLMHKLNFVQQFPQLHYYVRYLDDIFVISHPNSNFMQDSTNGSSFQESLTALGILDRILRNVPRLLHSWTMRLIWTLMAECSKTIKFLDLEIHLDLNG